MVSINSITRLFGKHKMTRFLLGLALFALLASRSDAQGPTVRLVWSLERAEVRVREDRAGQYAGQYIAGQYIVEAYLDLVPPPEAHPQVDPGPLEFLFHGDKNRQALTCLTSTLNGQDATRALSLEATGTRILLHIDVENRTTPLSVHLVVSLHPEAGRVALPWYVKQKGARVILIRPDRTRVEVDAIPVDLIVDAEAAAAAEDLPVLEVCIAAGVVAAMLILLLVLKRRGAGCKKT